MALACASFAQSVDFERDIRPLLASNCASCHNEKNRSSGLSLASRAGLIDGGNRGPALMPGDSKSSLIAQAVRHDGPLKMPPGRKLTAADLAKLEAWIDAGAVWPDVPSRTPKSSTSHWAFQPVRRSPTPSVRDPRWARNDIDRFILARLEREGLRPSPQADATTLMRRVHLDLTGLPPPPEEIAAYLADAAPGKYERLVKRLLASPHYGERWGRHWLDQARYADSDGGSRDEPRQIWKYREWVIGALNRDLPFDRFVVEQLAGDLLPNAPPEQIVATGFHRNSLLQIEAGTDREQYRVEAVSDRVDTTGTVFLGLSLGCARCHDHKYDPVTQKEYYQLFAFFNNIDEYGPAVPPFSETNDLEITHQPIQALGNKEDVAKYEALRAQILALYRERLRYRGGEQNERPKKDVGDEVRTRTIQDLRKQLPKVQLAMVMREMDQPRESHVLLGGDYLRKGIHVSPGVPRSLYPMPSGVRADRLALARWLVDPANPLLARVTVNRIWQQYFGLGLVETENDFGTQGAKPSHPELLDWLASEFVAREWSQKAIHEAIVTSAVYRQSSKARPEAEERDPGNRLLARQNRLRLDAEIVRDVALSASGLLNAKLGGESVYPPQPGGVMETGQVKQVWRTSQGADRYRRGLYTFHYRITPNPSMKVFDAANGLLPCTRRTRSNTPLQALALLNDPNFHETARGLAGRAMSAEKDRRLDFAMQLTVGRSPTAFERERLGRLYSAELDAFRTRPAEAAALAGKDAGPELAAWLAVSRVLMNTDEFITRE